MIDFLFSLLECLLGHHVWNYPKRAADGTEYANDCHRYCEYCGLEQHLAMFGRWMNDPRKMGHQDS